MKLIRQQFAETMLEVGKIDPNLVVVVGDISHFNLQPFARECPDRYYNIGICESAMMSIVAGLSKVGFYTVAHTIAPFIVERAFEQLKLDFCYQKLGGNVITVGSAFDYSNLGCTHHCYDDFALFKALDGSRIFYPSSTTEFDVLFRANYTAKALNLFRLPQHDHGVDFAPEDIISGKGLKVAEGTDATIVAVGPLLRQAMLARDKLAQAGSNVEVLYFHTIRPFDADLLLESVRKTGKVVVIEEHMRTGGVGEDVMRAIIGLGDVKFASIAIPDTFVRDYGTYEEQCERLGFSESGIIGALESLK